MKMNSTQLWDEMLKDNAVPVQEDRGEHIAEVMEGKLSSLLDKFQNRVNEAVEALNKPNNVEAMNISSEEINSPESAPEKPEQPNFEPEPINEIIKEEVSGCTSTQSDII